MDRMHQPALVRSAADLRILAAEINSAHKAGEESTRRGLEHFREAGLRLLKAKDQVGHGKWLAWLKENVHFSAATAKRYMALARRWDEVKSLTVSDLKGALKLLTEEPKKSEDEDDSTRGEPEDQDDSPNGGGDERVVEGQDDSAEEGQEGATKDLPADEAMPERYREIFACEDVFDAAVRVLTRAANALQQVEESPAYRAMGTFELQFQKDRNLTKRVYSSDCVAAARLMKGLKPAKLCPECKGIEASQDAEPCATCGGKGFLIADEVDGA